jgi:hypothetical protein
VDTVCGILGDKQYHLLFADVSVTHCGTRLARCRECAWLPSTRNQDKEPSPRKVIAAVLVK